MVLFWSWATVGFHSPGRLFPFLSAQSASWSTYILVLLLPSTGVCVNTGSLRCCYSPQRYIHIYISLHLLLLSYPKKNTYNKYEDKLPKTQPNPTQTTTHLTKSIPITTHHRPNQPINPPLPLPISRRQRIIPPNPHPIPLKPVQITDLARSPLPTPIRTRSRPQRNKRRRMLAGKPNTPLLSQPPSQNLDILIALFQPDLEIAVRSVPGVGVVLPLCCDERHRFAVCRCGIVPR